MATNMLTVPLRRTEPLQLNSALRSYIEQSYDQHPDMFKRDIASLEELRASILDLDIRSSSLVSLKKYVFYFTHCIQLAI